jgi:hypothetical protein
LRDRECVQAGSLQLLPAARPHFHAKSRRAVLIGGSEQTNENDMGGAGKQEKPPGKVDGKPPKPQPPPLADDDVEDGDIATPKQDRYGEDDQPL